MMNRVRRSKTLWPAAVAAALAVSLVVPPLAAGAGAYVSATGLLRFDSTTVAVDPGLALLNPDATTTSTLNAFLRAARRGGAPRPVGRLAWYGPEAGTRVAAGATIARIDPTSGRLFKRRARAEVEVASTNVEVIDDARSKLLDARSKLLDARSKLLDARTKARALFAKKKAQGLAAEMKLVKATAALAAQQAALESKLAQAKSGLVQALGMLAQAQALPDSDPTKAAKVAAAQAAVARAQAAVGALLAAHGKVSGGLAGVRAGLAKLRAGLAAGISGFAVAMTKMAQGLALMDTALVKLDQQYDSLGHIRIAVLAYVRGAKARLDAVKVLEGAYNVRSPITGMLVSRKVQPGQLVFGDQPVAVVAPAGRLILDLYVPLDVARGVRVGQTGRVTVDGLSDSFEASVRSVRDQVDFAPTDVATREIHLSRTVKVELDVADQTGTLKAGMPADVVIGASAP